MAEPLVVALPPNLELAGGYSVRVTALNPATGATVAGVNVSNVTLQVELTSGSEADLATGPFLLVTGPQG